MTGITGIYKLKNKKPVGYRIVKRYRRKSGEEILIKKECSIWKKKEAELYLLTEIERINKEDNELQQKESSVALPSCDDIKFDILLDEYLEMKKLNLKYSSYSAIEYLLKNHVRDTFGSLYLDQITPKAVLEWKSQMLQKKTKQGKLLKEKTLSNILLYFKEAFDYIERYYGKKNFSLDNINFVRSGEQRFQASTWDTNQIRLFLNAIEDYQIKLYFHILVLCASRKSEIISLTWDKIDWNGNRIKIDTNMTREEGRVEVSTTKTKADGFKHLPLDVMNELARIYNHRKNNEYEFSDQEFLFRSARNTSKAISKSTIDRAFKETLDRCPDLPKIRIHDLRHSSASYAYNHADLKTAQQLLQHTSADMSLRYIHNDASKDLVSNMNLHITKNYDVNQSADVLMKEIEELEKGIQEIKAIELAAIDKAYLYDMKRKLQGLISYIDYHSSIV